jgi:hypothetical protein
MKKRFVVPTFVLAGAVALTAFPAHAQSVEAQVASAVVDRMPEGAATSFPATVGELFIWSRVTDAGGTSIQHVWMHDGNEYPVSLAIGGSPWRTWSSKVIPPEWTGEWIVEIRAANGTVLETLTFTVG